MERRGGEGSEGEEDAAQRRKGRKKVLTGRPSGDVAVIRGGDNESGGGSD